jgi:hypothetical protein
MIRHLLSTLLRTPYLRALALALVGGAITGCDALLTRPILYGTVRVEAVSRTGAPLPGIRAELYTSFRPMGYAITDAQGRAVFNRVPRANYGVVMLLPSDYALLSEITSAPPGDRVDGLAIDAGVDTTLRFVFARRGLGALEAEVVNLEGAPLDGITVTFYSSGGILGARFTNSSGIARLDSVPFGQYGALIVPPDSLGITGQNVLFRDGLAVDRDFTPRARFEIPTCQGTIVATVRDQSDATVAGYPVSLYASTGIKRTLATGVAGTASFAGVACGNWGVLAGDLAGFAVTFERGLGFQDGLQLTAGASLGAELRVQRQ